MIGFLTYLFVLAVRITHPIYFWWYSTLLVTCIRGVARGPDKVRQAIDQSPQRSTRCHAQSSNSSDRSVRRVLHNYLQLFPYKL